MRTQPDGGIFEVGLAELNWTKRWKRIQGEDIILNLVTCISQYDRRVLGRRARVPGDKVQMCV